MQIEQLLRMQQELSVQAPKHIKKLGKILRRRSLFSLRQFLVEHGFAGKVSRGELPMFMDYLITNRIDLKDMHDEARARLRESMLKGQPEEAKTADYIKYVENGDAHCRDCEWFVKAPSEDEKSCVQLGRTRGADKACFGFTLKKVQ